MRVLISEFLAGGASSVTASTVSMRREGLAMLRAITSDVARLPGCSVVTTLDASLSHTTDLIHTAHCEVILIENTGHEDVVFHRLLRDVDAALVIAPETNGVLAARCQQVRDAGVNSWNCTPESIELCGDKLRLANHLQKHGIPTIPTRPVDWKNPPDTNDWPFVLKAGDCAENAARLGESGYVHWPVVLKPRDGAGSCLTFLVHDTREWDQAAHWIREGRGCENCLMQPFVVGKPLSIGVNISLDRLHLDCMAVGEQKLSNDHRFRYLGGIIPAFISAAASFAIENLVLATCRMIPGLVGYIGMDFILTDQGDPVIVEINPRLTTSYIGYRQLYSTSLPARWLSSDDGPIASYQQKKLIEFSSE